MLVGYLFGEDTKALDWEHHQHPLDCPQCTYVHLHLHPSPDPTFCLDHYSSLPPLFLLILHQRFSGFTSLNKKLHQGSSRRYAHCLPLSLLNPINVSHPLLHSPVPLCLEAWRRGMQLLWRAYYATGCALIASNVIAHLLLTKFL